MDMDNRNQRYNLPFCKIHSSSSLQFLQLGIENAKLICASCLFQQIQTEKNFDLSNMLDLIQTYENPDNILKYSNPNQCISKDEKFFYDFKKQLDQIKQKIEQLLNDYEKMQTELMSWKNNLLDIIRQNEFKQVFQQLISQEMNIKDEVLEQIQNKFQNYFQYVKQVNVQNQIQKLEVLYNNMSNKVQSNEQFQEIIKTLIKAEQDYKEFFCNQNKICENSFFQIVINTIQKNIKKKVIQKNKIYKSSEHGLTFQAIQNRVIGQENLLWFFKSSNNNGTVFGGFTPYKWQMEQYSGNNVENSSFLFSETLKEIYPIIQSQGKQTQYLNNQYILFGGTRNYDQDLRINPDFKSGYSRLGIGYQAPVGVDISKYSTHLFGALEPNIVECEIYQILFE